MTTVSPAAARPPLVLTIDIGTSSTRALLFDAAGRLIQGAAVKETASVWTDASGAAEVDPLQEFDRFARCVDRALAAAGPLSRQIGAVAVDTLASTIMAIDQRGRPLTPVVIYADTRNNDESIELRRTLDEAVVHERTGCLLRTSYWPARLAWFRRTQPDVWRTAAHWITLGEYLELRLFGRFRVGYSIASWGGLLDRRALTWDAPLLDALGLRAGQLAPLVGADDALRGLAQPLADRWPALRDVPWFPAIGDGAAANLGSGCTGHDRIALTVGTSGAVRVVQSQVSRVPAGLWCYRVDGRRALLGGATSEGGSVYSWMCKTLQVGERAEIEAELARMPADGHGLTILPLLTGERSPGWAGDVKATISGIALSTTPMDILRAALESVAYRFALIERRICGRADCDHLLIASGGALLSSPAWMQIIADVIGRPLVASAEPEATSRGAALLALEALGVIDSVDGLPAADGERYEPNPAHHERYQAAIERQQQLYEQVIGQPLQGHSAA